MELLDVLGETCNIRRASPRLNLSQPAVTKLLQEVEDLYGMQLFERLPRGLHPTSAGEVAIRWARLCLHDMGEALAEAHMVASGAVGRVRVGILAVAIPKLLCRVLALAQKEAPKLVVTVTEGSNDIMLPALARNEVDLILGRLTSNMDVAVFDAEPLYKDSVSLVVRKEHALAKKRRLAIGDLQGMDWILQPELEPMRRQLEAILVRNGVAKPSPRLETASVLLMSAMLSTTDMVAVMPTGVADLYEKQGQLRKLRMDLPIDLPPVGMVVPSNTLLPPPVATFISFVRKVARDLG